MFGTLGLGLCLGLRLGSGLGLGLGSALGLLLGLILFGLFLGITARAQHRPPTSDHNSSHALTVFYKNTCEPQLARLWAMTPPLVCAGL